VKTTTGRYVLGYIIVCYELFAQTRLNVRHVTPQQMISLHILWDFIMNS